MNTRQLLSLLSRHVGANNGITAAKIGSALNITMRRVRFLVTELREDGVVVCGTPHTGYYIAATAEELEETCLYLHHRAMHSLTLISRLRGVAMAELLGQMRLETYPQPCRLGTPCPTNPKLSPPIICWARGAQPT